jgi:hypothetical protein
VFDKSLLTVIDPGHKYLLGSIDGELPQVLQFVKRCDLQDPARFPGNTDAYPGTTLQIVLRALIDRVNYLQGQHGCLENKLLLLCLKLSIWLLEHRAARRHHRAYFKGLQFAASEPLCDECGHTVCEHQEVI